MERVPDRIKSFYRVNNLRRFRHDRPFHKGAKDRDNEFKVSSRSDVPLSLPSQPALLTTPPLSTTLPSLVLLESLDREDHPDARSPAAWYLAVVRGGQEGAGGSLVYKSPLLLPLQPLLLLSHYVVPLPPPAPPRQVEVSPLENALSVVENKNQELRTLIGQYQHKQLHSNVNLLSMTLNGVVDAAVNGGVARYQEVQWTDEDQSLSGAYRRAWLSDPAVF